MVWDKKLGSMWRRWDLHVHTPDTLKNNGFNEDWDQFINKVESAPPEISVVGFTDYYRIAGYKKLLQEKQSGRMSNIDMILPNVEFRLDISVGRDHKLINIHLLINPEDSDHTDRIEESLGRLIIEIDRQRYSCDERGLIRLGKDICAREHAHGCNDNKAFLRKATSSFHPSIDIFRTWYNNESWLKKNSIIIVSNNSNDGISGISSNSDRKAIKEEILRMSDAVFSGKQSDIDYYLGNKTDPADKLEQIIGGIKPCLHGSDAHNFEKMFEPDLQRYCWIKADPTFEGLKQVLFEPKERVYIGATLPNQIYPNKTIKSLSIAKSPNWYPTSKIEFNPGYVAVIGNKGSGKTALADLIAYTAGSWKDDRNSFLKKASKEFTDATVEIEWLDGHKSIETINLKSYISNSNEDREQEVRYLSQQFVESLCSEDRLGDSLRTEIEKVVFNHIDETMRLDSSDFSELRKKKTQTAIDKKQITLGNIRTDIDQYVSLGKEIYSKKDKLNQKSKLEAEINLIQKSMPKEDQAEKDLTAKITAFRELETRLIQEISSLHVTISTYQSAENEIDKFSKYVEDNTNKIKQTLGTLGISKEALDTLPMFNDQKIKNEIKAKIQETEEKSRVLTGQSDIKPLSEENLLPEKIKTLSDARQAIKQLELEETQDNEKRKIINKSLQDIQDIQKKIKLIEAEINKIDKHDIPEHQKLFSKITESYKSLFTSLLDEKNQLESLYAPLKERLSNGAAHEKRLTFFIQQEVDHNAWCERGYNIFNARKFKQIKQGSLEEFVQNVEEKLLPAWKNNDLSLIVTEISRILRDIEENGALIEDLLKGAYNIQDVYSWLFSIDHINMTYGIKYDGVSLEKLSPGTKGVILLMLYLEMDKTDNSPLIVDQPEENLDNQSVYGILTAYFREAKKRRQIIVITHNPNLVVNTDADQIIVAQSQSDDALEIRSITYKSGAIENTFAYGHPQHPGIKELCCDILEGGTEAFSMRDRRYSSRH